MTVTITATVDTSFWGDLDALGIPDAEVIELLQEDTVALLDGATWEIRREAGK